MATFTNSFFSSAGQKERLSNVANVLKISVTGSDLSGQKNSIVANTGSKTANTVLAAAANHPFITAGVAAAGITAVKMAPTILSGSAATSTAAAATSNTMRNIAIAGAGGIILGSVLNGGGKQDQSQNTTPNLNQNPVISPTQPTNQNPQTNPQQKSAFDVSGSNNRIRYSQNQDTYSTYNAYAAPTQYTPSSLTAAQTTSPQQSATQESGTNWLLIAGIAAGAYLLMNRGGN